jgi:uncharacterized protein (TIGR03437 family)
MSSLAQMFPKLPGWTINTVAGASYDGWGPRPSSQFSFQALGGVVADSENNVFIAAPYDARVYKMTPDGMMSVFAGSGEHYTGSLAVIPLDPREVPLGEIRDLSVDSHDNLYIQRFLSMPVKIDKATGNASLVDFDPTRDLEPPKESLAIGPDGPPFLQTAVYNGLSGVHSSFDPAGSFMFFPLAITDMVWEKISSSNPQILALDSGCLERITPAGPYMPTSSITVGHYPAAITSIACNVGYRMTRDQLGNIFTADGRMIHKITPQGVVTDIACITRAGYKGDCRKAASQDAAFIQDITVAPNGDIYVVEGGFPTDLPTVGDTYDFVGAVLWRIRGTTITQLTGSPFTRGPMDNWQDVYLEDPTKLTFTPDGDLIVYENDVSTGAGTTIVGLTNPRAYQLLRFSKGGPVTTLAGDGKKGAIREGIGTQAEIWGVSGLTAGLDGNLYIALEDFGDNMIRNHIAQVTLGGKMTSFFTHEDSQLWFRDLLQNADGSFWVAGGTPPLLLPWTLVKATPSNTVMIFDGGAPDHVRSPASVTTLARDSFGNIFYCGDSCAEYTPSGQSIQFGGIPRAAGIAVDDLHNIYIASGAGVFLRTPDNAVWRIAGIDTDVGFSGDGGDALNARVANPQGIALGVDGNLYLADSLNRRIRMLARETGPNPEVTFTDFENSASPVLTSVTVGQVIRIKGTNLHLGTIEVSDEKGNTKFLQLFPQDDASFVSLVPKLSPGKVRFTVVNQGGRGSIAMLSLQDAPFTTAITVSDATFGIPAIVAPGSLVACFGEGLAPSTEGASTTPYPTDLNGVTIRVVDASGTSLPAPLLFVSATQVNYVVPDKAATGMATFQVYRNEVLVAKGIFRIAPVAPGIFTANSVGFGVPAAQVLTVKGDQQTVDVAYQLSSTSTANTPKFVEKPIDVSRGSVYLILYGTGIRGAKNGAANVLAVFGRVDVPVAYAGPQPSIPTLDQVNLGPLPQSLKGKGTVGLQLVVDGQMANFVTLNFK